MSFELVVLVIINMYPTHAKCEVLYGKWCVKSPLFFHIDQTEILIKYHIDEPKLVLYERITFR